jgi:hypothetical protein
MLEEKLCLNCMEVIKGRSDKKFCDDQCRSSYNRDHSLSDAMYVKKINGALKRNRLILIEMNPDGKKKVLYNDMLRKGFDFGYFTSILRTGTNSYYYFCYEMGYLLINKEFVLLVKREDHSRMQARV